MRRRVVGILIAASVVGGVAAGVAATAITTDDVQERLVALDFEALVGALSQVEVREPVLVMNDDGTATLSATLINHTKKALTVNHATGGELDDDDAPWLLVHGQNSRSSVEPGVPETIGGVDDEYRIRLSDPVRVGSILPITIVFQLVEGFGIGAPATVHAKVVARTAAYERVANNGPNNDIAVRDGIIVVVPEQAKAYLGGQFESTIEDMTELRPVVEPRLGQDIEVLHQTATGGPSGFFARPGTYPIGQPPYLDNGVPGDREYVRASEVTAGQTITVTFRFPSGDVVGRFRVVQGNPDGTI
jgi:hypothetical protein